MPILNALVDRLVGAATVIVFMGPLTQLGAQVAAASDPDSFRAALIARAESEGAAYPAQRTFGMTHHTLRADTGQAGSTLRAGSGERKCVAGVRLGPVQSGEWVIGGELETVVAGRESKIWWAPFHNATEMPPLNVFARRLTPPADSFTFSSTDIGYPSDGRTRTPVPVADRKYFFPSGFVAPRPGVWLLTVTSGPNWGCFILTAADRTSPT